MDNGNKITLVGFWSNTYDGKTSYQCAFHSDYFDAYWPSDRKDHVAGTCYITESQYKFCLQHKLGDVVRGVVIKDKGHYKIHMFLE